MKKWKNEKNEKRNRKEKEKEKEKPNSLFESFQLFQPALQHHLPLK